MSRHDDPWPPTPRPGLVIAYSYLWYREYLQGEESGRKDRPCLLLTLTPQQRVTVLPITTKPISDTSGLALPADLRRALKLPSDASYLVYEEINHFTWPGPDLRRLKDRRSAYGCIPDGLLHRVQGEVLALNKAKRFKSSPRTD